MKPHLPSIAAAFAGLLSLATPVPAQAQENAVRVRTVVIDPGHGGHDAGCISRDKKTYEKTIALDIADRLAGRIRKAHPDVKALMTRSDDRYIPLDERAGFANNHDADLFISVHINAQDGGTSAHGYSIHCLGQSSRKGNDLFSKNLELCKRENSVILLEDDYTTKYQGFDPNDPQSYILFNLIQNSNLERSLTFAGEVDAAMREESSITYSRGVSQDPFLVLWRTTMPAVLVECGFMSNPSDLATLRTPEGRDAIAQAVADAFTNYKKKYDGVAARKEEAATGTADAPATTPAPAPESVRKDGVLYGTQVLATGKTMSPKDPFFAGYVPVEIKGTRLNKYVIGHSTDEAEARRLNREIRKKFEDSFLVRIEGDSVTRIQ